jgi:hypothetical protein
VNVWSAESSFTTEMLCEALAVKRSGSNAKSEPPARSGVPS